MGGLKCTLLWKWVSEMGDCIEQQGRAWDISFYERGS